MRVSKRTLLVALLVAVSVSGQTVARRASNLLMLVAHPSFFNGRQVLLVGDVTLQDSGQYRLSVEGSSVPLVVRGNATTGSSEVRGEFWDVGRMNAEDPRLNGLDLRRAFGIDPEAPWPRPGQVLAVIASSMQPAPPPPAPSIRSLVLYPSRYIDQTVTVVGQFSGRNLLGDLPESPAQSRYDFVLRSADAAIWVSNLRPRGKDFELSLDAKIDTGKWLEVSGRLQQARGLQWLDGQAGSVKLATPPRDVSEETQMIRVPAAPPPEVVFSAPIEDDVDVAVNASVRVQFSRDLDGSTIRGRVRATYSDAPPAADAPTIPVVVQYQPGLRVLEIKFAQPLERLRGVTIQLLDGILGTDKQPLAPWTLRFKTGA